MSGLELGGPAPDFTLRDQFGQDVRLSSYRGTKAVAIFFYPYAFSGVCTGEMTHTSHPARGVNSPLDKSIINSFDSTEFIQETAVLYVVHLTENISESPSNRCYNP